ncbi:hypothetical protein [Rhodopirellula bahusiensis]|uniref:Uncharacterized protein n=1 Tax=Rhodopirellula bahusiensis TaxID=2014065 RepID=A0A2G1W4I7_9BACT|nr:hypothetical protein [Rhodopirellula bahusiensis]PHQ33932.1 hypothetical protein CEE69_18730 [Rhodopirellula bahusiensis]
MLRWIRIFFLLWAIVPVMSLARAQESDTSTTNETFSLKLSMPTPIVHVNTEGDLALCAQLLPAGFDDGEKQLGTAVVRLVTVDLDSRRLLEQTDLPAKAYGFGIGQERLYIATLDTGEISALDARTHELLDTQSHEDCFGQLEVVANRLVCSSEGHLRLNLKDLTDSKRWAGLDPATLSKNAPLRRHAEVFAVEGAWHLDGMMFGEAMNPLLIVDGRMAREQLFGFWRMGIQDVRPIASMACRDLPLTVVVSPKGYASEEVGMDLVAKVFCKHQTSPLAEYDIGKVDGKYFRMQGERVVWKRRETSSGKAFGYALFGRYKPLRTQFYLGDDNNIPLAMANAHHRVVIASEGFLHVIDFGDSIREQVEKIPRLKKQQTFLAISLVDEEIVLKHELWAPLPEVRFAVSVPCIYGKDRAVVDASSGTARVSAKQLEEAIQNKIAMLSPERLDSHEQKAVTYFKQAFGKPPTGRCFLQPVNVTAVATSEGREVADSLRYSMIVEIPEATFLSLQQNKDSVRNQITAKLQQAEQKANLAKAAANQKRRQEIANEKALEKWREDRFNFIVRSFYGSLAMLAFSFLVLKLWQWRRALLQEMASADSGVVVSDSQGLRAGLLTIHWSMIALLVVGLLPLMEAACEAVGVISEIGIPMGPLVIFACCCVAGILAGTGLCITGPESLGSRLYATGTLVLGIASVLVLGGFVIGVFLSVGLQATESSALSVLMRLLAWTSMILFVSACVSMLLFLRTLAESLQHHGGIIRANVAMVGAALCVSLFVLCYVHAWNSSGRATYLEMMRGVVFLWAVIACVAFAIYMISVGLIRDLAKLLGRD